LADVGAGALHCMQSRVKKLSIGGSSSSSSGSVVMLGREEEDVALIDDETSGVRHDTAKT